MIYRIKYGNTEIGHDTQLCEAKRIAERLIDRPQVKTCQPVNTNVKIECYDEKLSGKDGYLKYTLSLQFIGNILKYIKQ